MNFSDIYYLRAINGFDADQNLIPLPNEMHR